VAEPHPFADVTRQVIAEKGAQLVAKRQFVGGEAQIHRYGSLVIKTKPALQRIVSVSSGRQLISNKPISLGSAEEVRLDHQLPVAALDRG
jgi:hypothetical protein